MISYRQKKWIVSFVGSAALAALAASVGPAGATQVCPRGIKPPSPYCANVQPVAFTGIANHRHPTSVTLNGHAGPGINNGDQTSYFFQYGRTAQYGKQTDAGMVPVGPADIHVSTKIHGLTPHALYHFRIVVFNSDGRVRGSDRTFRTKRG